MRLSQYLCNICKLWVVDTYNSDNELVSSKLLAFGTTHQHSQLLRELDDKEDTSPSFEVER